MGKPDITDVEYWPVIEFNCYDTIMAREARPSLENVVLKQHKMCGLPNSVLTIASIVSSSTISWDATLFRSYRGCSRRVESALKVMLIRKKRVRV